MVFYFVTQFKTAVLRRPVNIAYCLRSAKQKVKPERQSNIFKEYRVEYCYLFGSYAKGNATEKSDVDLLVSTEITGMKFFELVEVLREKLKKKVDILNQNQIKDNFTLVNEILKDGIKIYG